MRDKLSPIVFTAIEKRVVWMFFLGLLSPLQVLGCDLVDVGYCGNFFFMTAVPTSDTPCLVFVR